MKRVLVVLLAMCLMASAAGCGAAETKNPPAEPEAYRQFTDSLEREVTLPDRIEKVAVSGPMAQIFLFALCPDKLVGIANEWNAGSELFLQEEHLDLPVLGQLYGAKGELNLETLIASDAQIVIDVGEPKDSTKDDLDTLQAQTGIPFVHITANTENSAEAFRTLGSLLDMEAEAEVLAEYYERVYRQITDLSRQVEKKGLLYVTGGSGQNVIARGAYHAEIVDMLSNNLAVVDTPSAKGTGNEVSMEQILLWDPEVILFAPDSCYDTVAEDPVWQEVTAIQTGNYYQVPFGVYDWMGFPPSVQRCPGMLWMGKLLYPEAADYDLYALVAEYYELFYHCQLSEEMYASLTEDSTGKQVG